MDLQLSQSALILAAVISAASVGTWVFIIQRFNSPEGVLPMQPRLSVTWTGWHVLLVVMIFLFVQTTAASLSGVKLTNESEEQAETEGESDARTPDEVASVMSYLSLSNLLGVALSITLLVLVTQARTTDFGWMEDGRQLLRDAILGGLGFFAATLPVLSLQVLVTRLIPYEHPVLSMLSEGGSLRFWLVATLSAAVVAPLAEEFVFRVVLQGWLERLALGKKDGVSLHSVEDEDGTKILKLERQPVSATAVWPLWVSAAVFAMLHLGQGPAPIPLLLLGALLGYIYRQTHRIVPCIVLHSLFNTLSLILFRLSISPAE